MYFVYLSSPDIEMFTETSSGDIGIQCKGNGPLFRVHSVVLMRTAGFLTQPVWEGRERGSEFLARGVSTHVCLVGCNERRRPAFVLWVATSVGDLHLVSPSYACGEG